MDRAGHRCQCTQAGHPNHRKAGRCQHTGWTHPGELGLTEGRLIAGPARPVPRPERIIDRAPVEELQAWCLPCWAHAVKLARQAVNAAPPQAEGLF